MEQSTGKLTVYFEEPFWVGVYERIENGELTVAKVVFGAEPKDYEIYDYFLNHVYTLRFSSPITQMERIVNRINPKRLQRQINTQLSHTGVGTKAQQALKLQQEQNKMERKAASRQKTEAEQQRHFELRQQKKKNKHKGR